MTNVRFEWDEAKNLSNQRKHEGVSFEEACQVFCDPLHVSVQDRIEGGEQRWQTVGAVRDLVILVVAHTVTEEVRRRIGRDHPHHFSATGRAARGATL